MIIHANDYFSDSKQEFQYSAVLQATNTATEFSIETCYPDRIMTDFVVGIINK